MKAAAVLLYASGLSMNCTAKLLGVSMPTIQAWLEQFAAAYAQKPEPEGRAVVMAMRIASRENAPEPTARCLTPMFPMIMPAQCRHIAVGSFLAGYPTSPLTKSFLRDQPTT